MTDYEALKAQHGKLCAVELEDGTELIFRKPKRADYERFQTTVAGNTERLTQACRELMRSCLVQPDVAGLEAAINEAPGLVDECMPLLHQLAKGGARGKAI